MRSLVVAGAFLWGTPAAAQTVDRWSGYIAEGSARAGIPAEWIRRVMRAESGGRILLNGRPITSNAGAMGLMQLMPATWREMRARLGLGPDPHDPRDNILAGAAYLRLMYERFGYPGLFAAYNAGPARFANHLATGRRLPAETVSYVATVSGRRQEPAAAPSSPRRAAPLFAARGEGLAAAGDRNASRGVPGSGSLFVRLSTASGRSE